MKKITTYLFITGIIIESIALIIGIADKVPFIMKTLSPAYRKAMIGVESLKKEKKITSNNVGFSEMTKIFKNDALEKGNPKDIVDLIEVKKIVIENAILSITKTHAKEKIPIVIYYNNTKLTWNMEDLEKKIEKLKRKNLVNYSIFIFMLGVGIQIFGRIRERNS